MAMHPTYLAGPNGLLFSVLHLPDGPGVPTQWILHLPAFAEELNKCRAMVSMQARELAREGFAVLLPDLTGTGDSEGDFGDASWNKWLEDVRFVLGWMTQQGAAEIDVWGVRLGALLSLRIAAEPGVKIRELMLWQPVYSGKQALNQFLRLRVAAGLMQGQGETVSQLRERCESGESVEVAGYSISTDLFRELDTVDAASIQLPAGLQIRLREVVGEADKPLLLNTRKFVESWSSEGLGVDADIVLGEPFWCSQEIAFAPELVEETARIGRVALPGLAGSPSRLSGAGGGGEKAVTFTCQESELLGVLHTGEEASTSGVLLVVGGPQYRVGSHRQFVLLSRDLAQRGIPVFRFDYRGMGDSAGAAVNFLNAQDDIKAAMDTFFREYPALQEVVIWGLCDAATAGAFYAVEDSRVAGLVLLNPWVRSDTSESRALIKHYYLRRLFSKGFWSKFRAGGVHWSQSFQSLLKSLKSAMFGGGSDSSGDATVPLAQRLERSLHQFKGEVLLILSGNDLTSAEFSDAVAAQNSFRKLLAEDRFSIRRLEAADHTFSRALWRNQVSKWTADFMERM